MGIETAIVVGGLSLAKGIGEYNQAKSGARATAREGEIAIANRKKEIQDLVAKQKIGYLQSGVELEGTAQAVMQDTYQTGIKDVQALASSYNKNIKNQLTSARARLLGSIASSAVSAYSIYNSAATIEDMSGVATSYNPATTPPPVKPVYGGV